MVCWNVGRQVSDVYGDDMVAVSDEVDEWDGNVGE